MTLSKNLKKFRKAANLTQQNVAEILMIKPNTYGAWENEKSNPSAYYLPKIAALFNVEINALFESETQNMGNITPPP